MMRLILILILILGFQSLTKADDLRDFEIEGISLGDSLLNFYTKEEIDKSLPNVSYYPKSKKFKVIRFNLKDSELYDSIQAHIKDNNKDYIIYAIKGVKNMPIDECLKSKEKVINEINKLIPNATRYDEESGYGKSYGSSIAYTNNFELDSGQSMRIWCTHWDENNELIKNNLWKDDLSVSLYTKEINNFITNEAYD
tara:strand:+ start:690 stop:1280 length:591 start_codon:yes stop_codon:yes gene_type:complete